MTRAVADLWILVALAVVLTGAVAWGRRGRAAAALLAAFALVIAPWTVRNLVVLHAFVPGTTEAGYTLAGEYNATVAAPGPLQSVWQVPLGVPSIAARLAHLYQRPQGVDEAQLDAALRTAARRYIQAHPGYVVTAVAHDAMRLLDLGPGHGLQNAIIDRQLAVPHGVAVAVTLAGRLLAVLALLGLLAAIRGRAGPWWLWALALTALLETVIAVGNELKRVPLDPFLILLVACAADRLLARLSLRRRRADTALGQSAVTVP